MRKSKVLQLDVAGKKEVTIKEVSPYAAYKALLAKDKVAEMIALAENCIDLTPEQIKHLYASEIKEILSGFFEINDSFLAIADMLGIKDTIGQMMKKALGSVPQIADEMLKGLPPAFSTLYKEAMEKLPGTMDGDTSSSPSKPSLVKRSK